jgi:Acetyltransferase (GNAT) domain
MIVIRKNLRRVVPYRLILWPTETYLKEVAENLPLTHYARVAFARTDLDEGKCIVSHTLSLTLLVDLQRPLGAIYKDLIDNARIRIHKAEKLGNRLALRRYKGGPDQDRLVEQFVALYNDFAHGKPVETSPVSVADKYSFFPNADLVMAYLDNQPICGHLNLVDRETGTVRLQDSANRRFHDPATARLAGIVNVYLHWYELEKYREEGFAAYDFGSLGQVEDSVGVNRFKMQFGGTIIREHNFILAGMPAVWRAASNLMCRLSRRWKRRAQVQKAGERWRDMPLEAIRQTIESSVADYQRNLQARQVRANGKPSNRPASAVVSTGPLGFENKHDKASQSD